MAKIAKVQEVALTKLKPYEKNAKIHGQEQVEKLKASIEEFGFLTPCLIDADFNLIAGHGRVMAAKQLGMEKVPCVFIEGLSEAQRRAYILADNRLGELGTWDMDLVTDELFFLDDEDFVVELTGFDLPEGSATWFEDRERYDTSREEGNEEYNDFLDKFELKKTTDDCYTPDMIYEAVADWVAKEYKVKRNCFVRPFYPNGDYQNEKYKKTDIVVDNPPFSILSEILNFYVENDIRFFLFAPTLTLFSGRGLEICYLPVGVSITYENGAKVNTSFITNMEEGLRIRTAPDLFKILKDADQISRQETKESLPNYEYPPELITAAAVSRYSVHGVEFMVGSNECYRVSDLDEMKKINKAIYGGGFLLGEEAAKRNMAAKKAQIENVKKEEEERLRAISTSNIDMTVSSEGVIVFQLSEREKEIVRSLGNIYQEKGGVNK